MFSTIGELVKAKAILLADVEAAVAVYIADPKPGEVSLGSGYVLDVGEVVSDSFYAKSVTEVTTTSEIRRRNAVRTAILLATPKKS